MSWDCGKVLHRWNEPGRGQGESILNFSQPFWSVHRVGSREEGNKLSLIQNEAANAPTRWEVGLAVRGIRHGTSPNKGEASRFRADLGKWIIFGRRCWGDLIPNRVFHE